MLNIFPFKWCNCYVAVYTYKAKYILIKVLVILKLLQAKVEHDIGKERINGEMA